MNASRPLFTSLHRLGVQRVLAGMRVEAAVVAVEHARSEVGEMHLRDRPSASGRSRCSGYFTSDLYLPGATFRMSAPFSESRPVVPRYSITPLPSIGLYIRAKRSSIARRCCLVLDARQEAVGLERAGHAGHRHARHGQGAEQAWAEAHGRDHVLLLRVELAHNAAQPSLGADLVGLAGVPDVHGAEMRARRIEVADAVHDGELALVPELLHGRQVRRDAVGLVQLHDLIVADRRPPCGCRGRAGCCRGSPCSGNRCRR